MEAQIASQTGIKSILTQITALCQQMFTSFKLPKQAIELNSAGASITTLFTFSTLRSTSTFSEPRHKTLAAKTRTAEDRDEKTIHFHPTNNAAIPLAIVLWHGDIP